MSDNIFRIIELLELNKGKDTLSFIMKYSKKRMFKTGDILVKEGDKAEKVYIILSGEALVFKYDHLNNIIELATLGQGNLFGEMAIFMEKRRSASVKAKTDLIVAEFGNIDFIKALADTPDLMFRVISSFVDNVNDMNNRISKMTDLICRKSVAYYLNLIDNKQEIMSVKISDAVKNTHLTAKQFLEVIKDLFMIKLIVSYKVVSEDRVDISIDREMICVFLLENNCR